MIQEVTIENFKSVQHLSLALSRFNVLIGSNGSGKSNILEAITFAGAASADKLDNEFLASRGIRPTTARLTKSAFNSNHFLNEIILSFTTYDNKIIYTIEDDNKPISSWNVKERNEIEQKISEYMQLISFDKMDELIPLLYKDELRNDLAPRDNINHEIYNEDLSEFMEMLKNAIAKHESNLKLYNVNLANFLIYSPEISSLRKFEEESQIKPLGIKGEGIFNVLQIFNEVYGKETLEELKHYLHIIEWFKDFEAVADSVTGRKSLVVKDRYMPDVNLNQNNVNEGFLFLLFYISLFISKETPTFFAIDNIEASFHPRLCEALIRNLVELSKKHNKQVILTTHNPFVLDGLDLNDDEQTLFVVRRNADGETIADQIKTPPIGVKLSEAWERGYIGGQPETIE